MSIDVSGDQGEEGEVTSVKLGEKRASGISHMCIPSPNFVRRSVSPPRETQNAHDAIIAPRDSSASFCITAQRGGGTNSHPHQSPARSILVCTPAERL